MERNVQNLAVTSSRHKMARYRRNRNGLQPVKYEETSVEISDDENDNDVDDENQVNNEKLEIKSENQPSPKTAVRTTKPPRRYDEYESH